MTEKVASNNTQKASLTSFLSGQAKEWVSFHRQMAYGIWYRLMVRSHGNRFDRIYNLSARLKGVDVRSQSETTKGRTVVTSGVYRVEAYPQRRALNYANSIEERARSLGEDYQLPLIEFNPGDVVLDCGANVGDLKLYFRLIGVDVEYVGIEPGPGEFPVLERNVAPSRAINVGLWNEDGELAFYVASDGADSSLIEPNTYDSIIKVPTRRLDRLVDYPRIKLFKLEAEGAEPEALEGASGLLDRIEFITADLGAERGKEEISTLPHVTNSLLANGFELVAVNHRRVSALYRNTHLSQRA